VELLKELAERWMLGEKKELSFVLNFFKNPLEIWKLVDLLWRKLGILESWKRIKQRLDRLGLIQQLLMRVFPRLKLGLEFWWDREISTRISQEVEEFPFA
jgi:hypothetical protein